MKKDNIKKKKIQKLIEFEKYEILWFLTFLIVYFRKNIIIKLL